MTKEQEEDLKFFQNQLSKSLSKITLCDACFPPWGEHEVLCIVAHGPCAACGRQDAKRCHVFRTDPRLDSINIQTNPLNTNHETTRTDGDGRS